MRGPGAPKEVLRILETSHLGPRGGVRGGVNPSHEGRGVKDEWVNGLIEEGVPLKPPVAQRAGGIHTSIIDEHIHIQM